MGSQWMSRVTSHCHLTTVIMTYYRSICELRVTGGHNFFFFNLAINLQHADSVCWNYAQGTHHQGIYGPMHAQTSLLEYIFCQLKTSFAFTTGRNSPNYFWIPSRLVTWKRSRFPLGSELDRVTCYTTEVFHGFGHSLQTGHDRAF
jgi:hypothetical protein